MLDSAMNKQTLSEKPASPKRKNQELEKAQSKRKRLEAVLQQSGELQRTILQTAMDGFWMADLQGHLLEVNDAYCRMSGYSTHELLSMRIHDLEAAETRDETSLHAQKVMTQGEDRFESRHRRKDGSIFDVEACVQYRPTDGGRLVGFLRDITKRKRAEQEMAILAGIGRLIGSSLDINEVYERFAGQVRTFISCDRISIDLNNPADETFTVAYVSGVDIPGRRPGDTVPRKGSITEIILRARTSLLINQATLEEITKRFPDTTNITTVRAGMRSLISVPLIFRDEVIGTLHLRARKANAYTEQDLSLAEKIGMQIAGAIANAQLYAGLARVEADLRGKEEQLRILSNNIPAGLVFQIDSGEDGKERSLVYISEGVERLHGVTVSEALNDAKFTYRHVIEDDWQLLSEMQALAIANESTFRAEVRRRSPSGDIRWSLLSSAPRRLPNNHLVWDGIEIDITERKQAEDALQETLDQLESRVRDRTIELEETNTALRVLLKQGDRDQKMLGENLQANVNELVMPFLSKLRARQSNHERLTCLNILETNLSNIVSPFINQLSTSYRNLTPKEIQIADLIRQGKRSKEIAQIVNISVRTVDVLRYSVRKKLGLNKKKANLQSFLSSL